MASEDVIKTVAKKLKYYVDIKRREDGFDLSGPYLPPHDPMPQRAGPTLAYDGLHDRSLKHYFRNPEVKKQVCKMFAPPSPHSARDMDVRRIIDSEMSKRSYSCNMGSNSPYLIPSQRTIPRQRPHALISVDEYLKTEKGSKQRKIQPNYIGKSKKVLRRSPPKTVSKNERERIIDMAARLIVATETAALPGNRSSQIKTESSMYEHSLPDVNGKSSFTEDSTDSELIIPNTTPRPPSRHGGPRPRWTPPHFACTNAQQSKGKTRKIVVKSPFAASNTNENNRTNQKNGKVFGAERRPLTASTAVRKKTQQPSTYKERPNSARVSNQDKKNRRKETHERKQQTYSNYSADSSDDDDTFGSSQQIENDEVDSSKLFYKRPPQSRNNSKYRILTYQVYVVTGNYSGAGTNADIKLTLFGDNSSSGERPLLKSMNHSQKFQKGQVDIFAVDSVYLGQLQNIRIGHSKCAPESGWFLETVYISEGQNENIVFEFSCHRWFSSQKDDGQILRDICLSRIITETELNEKLNDCMSAAEKTTDDESYSTSSDDSDRTEEKNEKHFSSDDQSSLDKRPGGRQSSSRKKTKNKEHNRKKVSFKGEGRKQKRDSYKSDSDKTKTESDSDVSQKDTRRKSENSSSEDDTPTNSGDKKSESKNSKVKNSEGKKSEDENSKGKHPEGRSSTDKNSKNNSLRDKTDDDIDDGNSEDEKEPHVKTSGGATSQGKTSVGGKKLDENNQGVRSSVGDDFWSNNTNKPEQIYYDLGADENKSKSSSSSKDEAETNTDDVAAKSSDHVSGAELKQTTEESDPRPSEDSDKEYMAGFLAGVKASKHDKDTDHEGSHHEDDAVNESDDEEEEAYVLRKGPSLHIAVANGEVERVRELVQHKPSLREQNDEKGWSPLHVGCANGQLDCVKLLAVNGGNLEEETPTGYTSMHLAAMNGHVNCMMVLFALGAEINGRTIDEYTPLHLAAMSGHVECVKWLLANRAKSDVKDNNGRTPAEIAEEYCYTDVGKLLESFKKELARTDSTLSHLMTYEGTRKKSLDSVASDVAGTSSKVADSGIGGLESGEESWISDNETDDRSSGRPSSARHSRPSSAKQVSDDDHVVAKNITDSITTIEEKQKLYERQRQQMKKRHSSFLDSIRRDVEDEFQEDT